MIWQLISSGEKVLYHYLEVTVEANIYVVTSPPKFAPDATDMGILVETNSSPQKTSESHQPGGKVREKEKKNIGLIGSPGTHSNPMFIEDLPLDKSDNNNNHSCPPPFQQSPKAQH